ncbi:lantibiotic immunity ABC transporter MutG family permease subunit [Paenibacillus phocaensis]|uniref:lantibiotic immunity ABC transporter MutG family permease subunit n=1 Tax=Paenibacillus phocaensis TaxID=1776378 RepID=UPI000839CE13|nr:lantibiotic immunity ABC transporter MutG family permease subunit [Paenibacillus phocaensis]
MLMYFRSLRSELIKLRRQPMLWVHLLVPLAGIGIFLGYYAYTPFLPASKVSGYLQVLAIAYPTLIGMVCAIATDQEAAAGRYQQLLTLPSRLVPLASKLTLLLILGLGSTLLAAAGFGAGFLYLLNQPLYSLEFYVKAAGILFGSCIFLYALHLYVSLRFGKAASIGLGILGSLIAALLLTGLGDRNWIYIPYAWAARFITLWMQYGSTGVRAIPAEQWAWPGILCCLSGTVAIMVLLGGWFRRWEGKKSLE